MTHSATLARLSAPALAFLVFPWLAPPAAAQDAPESAPASRPESAPSSPESKRALGAELLRMGRRAEAIQAFREAYELDGALESGLEWSRALLADARWNDTLRALDAIAEKHPKRVELFLAFAEAQAARAEARRREGAGDVAVAAEYEAAARSIQDALEVKPGEFDFYFRLTRYFIAAGKADEAIDVNGEARKKNPKAWQIPVCEGDARVAQLEAEGLLADKPNADDASKADRKEKLDAARAAYEEAARLGADRAEPSSRLAALLLRTGGDKVKARELYKKALSVAPGSANPAPLLAVLTPKEAVAFFEGSLAEYKKLRPGLDAKDPGDAPIHWYLGYTKYLNEDRKGAEEEYRLVTVKSPEDMTARYYLGKIAYLDRRFDEAVKQFDTIARRSPRDLAAVGGADALYMSILAGLVEKLIVGDSSGSAVTAVSGNPNLDTAIRFQRAILEFDPGNAREWNNLGLFLRDGGRAQDALDAYKRALELTPNDPRVCNDTAVVYHYYLKTNDAEARRLYEAAIKLAKEIVASKSASGPAKADAQSALADAEGNLRKLNANNRKND